MPEYPPGTPSWVELSSPDADASAAFYGSLGDVRQRRGRRRDRRARQGGRRHGARRADGGHGGPDARRRGGQGLLPGSLRLAGGTPAVRGCAGDLRRLGGRRQAVGGMMAMNEDFFGPEIPSHWASAFAVADCDAILDSARELGARVTFGPIDSAIG